MRAWGYQAVPVGAGDGGSRRLVAYLARGSAVTLPVSVLLGRNMPSLQDLIVAGGSGETEAEVLATTRAQARQQQEEEAEHERTARKAGASLCPV